MVRVTRTVFQNSYGYWKRYVERQMFQGWRAWKGPLVGWKGAYKKEHEFYYDENRPWTDQFKQKNMYGIKNNRVYVEPIKEWKIFKGDRVEVLVGKDKGKQGTVNSIIKERNWCFVQGLHCKYEAIQSVKDRPGQLMKVELPLMVTTEVAIVDPGDEKSTEVEWRYTEQGERVRVSVRTGRIVPLPTQSQQLEDFVLPSTYTEGDKDTKEKDLTEISFIPVLKTFEQDILDQTGIKEDRKPAKTYWW